MAGVLQVAVRLTCLENPAKRVFGEAIRCVSSTPVYNASKHRYRTPTSQFNKATTTTRAGTTIKAGRRIDSVAVSLASKGFLRSRNPYVPTENVVSRIKEIFDSQKIPTTEGYQLKSLDEKFAILQACSISFNHSVPNSQLYEIKTIGDIITFYETPVETATPFDALKRAELPENLHIQHEYVRFHPETDRLFGGKSAFPKSSTLVTGLKYRNKYQGHVAKRSWP